MVEVKRSSTASKFISKKNWPEPKKKFILLYNFSISYLWTTRTIAVVHLSESSTVILHFPQIIFSVVKQKGVKVSWHNKIIMGLNCSMSAGGGLSLIITLVPAVLKTWQTLRRLQNKRYRTISKLYVLRHLSRGPIKCFWQEVFHHWIPLLPHMDFSSVNDWFDTVAGGIISPNYWALFTKSYIGFFIAWSNVHYSWANMDKLQLKWVTKTIKLVRSILNWIKHLLNCLLIDHETSSASFTVHSQS